MFPENRRPQPYWVLIYLHRFEMEGHIQLWIATPKLEKESRSRGCEAQAFSRSCVKFLSAIHEVCWGKNSLRFLRKILAQQAFRILVSSALPRTMRTSAFKRFAMILWSANSFYTEDAGNNTHGYPSCAVCVTNLTGGSEDCVSITNTTKSDMYRAYLNTHKIVPLYTPFG